MKINLGKQFGRYPAGRYLADGPYNGQKFREEFLIPALKGADGKEDKREIGTIILKLLVLRKFLGEHFLSWPK